PSRDLCRLGGHSLPQPDVLDLLMLVVDGALVRFRICRPSYLAQARHNQRLSTYAPRPKMTRSARRPTYASSMSSFSTVATLRVDEEAIGALRPRLTRRPGAQPGASSTPGAPFRGRTGLFDDDPLGRRAGVHPQH